MSLSLAAGTALAAGITAAGATTNNIIQGKMSDKQRVWNEMMMDRQNKWSVDMYNKYQSPLAQRQQMLDAGINPLSSDMSSGSMPTSAASNNYSLPSLENPAAAGMQAYLQAKQAANLDADSEQKYAETARTKLIAPLEARKLAEENEYVHQQIDNLIKSGKYTDEQITQLQILNKWADKEHEMQLNKVISDTKVNEALAAKTEEERKSIIYTLENLLPLDVENKKWSIEEAKERIKEIQATVEKIGKENNILEQDLINYAFNHMPNNGKTVGALLKQWDKSLKKQSGWISQKLQDGVTFFYDRLMQAFDLDFN